MAQPASRMECQRSTPLAARSMALPLGLDMMPVVSLVMVALIWRELKTSSGRDALAEGDVHPV